MKATKQTGLECPRPWREVKYMEVGPSFYTLFPLEVFAVL